MITAIICAAGSGTRTGFRQNKILKELNGLPVLCYSLSAFAQNGEIGEILVACRKEDEPFITPLLSPFPNARICYGGITRAETVHAALKKAKGKTVLIHDAARPFVTQQIITECIGSVKKHGSGVAVYPATDTVAITKNGRITETTDRTNTFSVQTPQGFEKEKLLCAYEKAFADGAHFTDESGVYAKYIAPPAFFLSSPQNKKLTYAEDFLPAERAGFGVDTHAFGKEQSFITLAGIKIPSKSGLIAHSDGDVLVHALMDALLSAAGLRDIGFYFPDTDGKYKDADSMDLLAKVLRLVAEQGFAPKNASISVLAETPRLAPFIEDMRDNLACSLNLPRTAVGIAAGTNEKLGYVGEGKGITCYATVLLCSVRKE